MRKISFRIVWLRFVGSWLLADHLLAVAYGPPRLRLPTNDLRKVVSSGQDAVLPCPVRADPATLFLEWFEGDRPLSEVGKYRLTPSGSLRIRRVTSSDTGHYTCRAVNGFGSVQIRVFLLVIDESDSYDYSSNQTDGEEFAEVADSGGPPRFTFVTSFNGSVIQSSTGGSVRLKCAGTGDPAPKIFWLKNGVRLKSSAPGPARVPDSPSNSHEANETRNSKISTRLIRKKWFIQLEKLRRSDSGNYTCVLRNPYGSISTSFVLEVIDGTKPEVTGYHPLNTTVEYGSSATFQCRVRSEIPPHIKWLKKLEAKELASLKEASSEGSKRGDSNKQRQRVIIVQGEPFRFLKSSRVLSKPDGSFLNKLYIREARESDSGKYICVGANSLGYSYRGAFLTVMRRPHAGILNWERTVVLRPGQPDAVMIGIPITVGVLVGVIVALAILCHSRRAREISERTTTIWTNPHPSATSGGSPALKSVEQQTSFSSFPPPNFRIVTKEEFLGCSSTETDSFGGLAYPSSLCETTTVSSYKPHFFNSEAIFQERSVVAKLHDCSPKDRYDCFFLRDNV